MRRDGLAGSEPIISHCMGTVAAGTALPALPHSAAAVRRLPFLPATSLVVEAVRCAVEAVAADTALAASREPGRGPPGFSGLCNCGYTDVIEGFMEKDGVNVYMRLYSIL